MAAVPRSAPPPARVSFSRPVWAAMALFAVLMIAILATLVILIEDQRTTTDRQLAATAKQADAAVPLIREARPLVRETIAALPRTQQLTRRALTLTRAATPLVQDFSDARAPEQLQAAGALARTLLAADVGAMTRAVARADLPALAGRLTTVADQLLRQDRLQRLLVRSTAVLGEVRARDLVAKSGRAADTVPEIAATLRESLAVQRETLQHTRELAAIGRETLAIVRDARDITRDARDLTRTAARAAESLDRKTGPSLAGPSGG
jgi:hypothetical protein